MVHSEALVDNSVQVWQLEGRADIDFCFILKRTPHFLRKAIDSAWIPQQEVGGGGQCHGGDLAACDDHGECIAVELAPRNTFLPAFVDVANNRSEEIPSFAIKTAFVQSFGDAVGDVFPIVCPLLPRQTQKQKAKDQFKRVEAREASPQGAESDAHPEIIKP